MTRSRKFVLAAVVASSAFGWAELRRLRSMESTDAAAKQSKIAWRQPDKPLPQHPLAADSPRPHHL